MKTLAASLIALGLIAGAADARPIDRTFTDLGNSAPRSVFADIQSSAPRSLFDQIQDAAPLSADTGGSVRQDLSGE